MSVFNLQQLGTLDLSSNYIVSSIRCLCPVVGSRSVTRLLDSPENNNKIDLVFGIILCIIILSFEPFLVILCTNDCYDKVQQI